MIELPNLYMSTKSMNNQVNGHHSLVITD